MKYIVLDMEWNQSYPKNGEDVRKRKPRNEIIEIGAARLDENMDCESTFKRLVRPVFVKKLNSHVKKLTGITAEMLREGEYFPEVIRDFRDWCGEDSIMLTWGYDDIPMLISCLKMYGLDTGWVGKWYNLQIIFNAQTDSGSNQKSLRSAMEYFGFTLDEDKPWHDALNDAAYTAVICKKLDIKRGIQEYDKNIRKMSPSTTVVMGLKEVSRSQYRCTSINGRSQCPEAFNNNPCPRCGAPMVRGKWVQQGRGKMVTIGECKTHGRFFMQICLIKTKPEKTARKIIYESNPEAEAFYTAKQKK